MAGLLGCIASQLAAGSSAGPCRLEPGPGPPLWIEGGREGGREVGRERARRSRSPSRVERGFPGARGATGGYPTATVATAHSQAVCEPQCEISENLLGSLKILWLQLLCLQVCWLHEVCSCEL